MIRMMAIPLICMSLALVACSDEDGRDLTDAGAGDVGQPGHDVAPSEDTNASETERTLEIFIENQSSRTIYAQLGHTGAVSHWFTILDGDDTELRVTDECLTPCGEPCLACRPAPPAVKALATGERISHSWDGTFYPVLFEDECVCTRPHPIAEAPFKVIVCYGETLDDSTISAGESIKDPSCAEFTLALGSRESVGTIVLD